MIKPNQIFKTSLLIDKSYKKQSFLTSKNLFYSFKYAFKGINYSFTNERNFRIHIFLGFVSTILGIVLKISSTELAILILTIAAVLILELINTSIEAVVDLTIGRRFHPLAKIAKDCSAAAVLIASISALLIAILLLLPKIINHLVAHQF